MDSRTLNSYLIKEIQYHSLLELTGNYWSKAVMDFVREQNPKEDFTYWPSNFELEFLNNPEKSKKLKNLLDKKFLTLQKYEEKATIGFKTIYLVFFNSIMEFFATLTLCSFVVLPIFLFPLSLPDVAASSQKIQDYMPEKFIISEEFIQNEFVQPLLFPSPGPVSAPSGLRIIP